ncbi:MAG: hypothetical protein JST92_19035, partial [Deltaproteobacteria bacterium]|nr:hypothetical protein [Deltaproteobacteria bacterium]
AMLGFASTDFVITMTLSAADAAEHAVHNPLLHPYIGDHQITITCFLLILLAGVFLKGFTEAIGVATLLCVPYLLLNALVTARGLMELWHRPELLVGWKVALLAKGSPTALLLASIFVFPRLALGLSGFETGVSVMPTIEGSEPAGSKAPPRRRIQGTRNLLVAAASIMSVMLLTTSLVTTTLIPAADFEKGGPANGRALAHLAHELMGPVVGSAYDFITIAILWFAGASAMAGMLNLIPRYLPRFGMAPKWAEHARPLVLMLLAIDLLVTFIFQADVDAQGGAYATGVLALMLSAAVAVAMSLWREGKGIELPGMHSATQRRAKTLSIYFWLVAVVFAFTFFDNILSRPDGLIISVIFIAAIVVMSTVSRVARADELRVETLIFDDPDSENLWKEMRGKKVNLAPLRTDSPDRRRSKMRALRKTRLDSKVAMVHIEPSDDRSSFGQEIRLWIERIPEGYFIHARNAAAIPNAIAYLSEQLDPIAIYFDLSLENPLDQTLRFLLFGEGEVGVMVYQILVRYWRSSNEEDVRPDIYLVSR